MPEGSLARADVIRSRFAAPTSCSSRFPLLGPAERMYLFMPILLAENVDENPPSTESKVAPKRDAARRPRRPISDTIVTFGT